MHSGSRSPQLPAKGQQLLGVAQSKISDMTFAAIRSVHHCALNGNSEMSSPGEYPSRDLQKLGAVGRSPEWGAGVCSRRGRKCQASKSSVTGSSEKCLC